MFYIRSVDSFLDRIFANVYQAELAQKSIALGLFTSIALIFFKFIAWMMTDSISMQASMNDSAIDAIASFISYYALKYSIASVDEEHNFGHGKVEGIMSLAQCLFIIISGCFIFHEAYARFLEPKPISNPAIGVVIMIISTIAVYILVYFQKYVLRKTDSMIVQSDSLHYISDFFMNIGVGVSIITSSKFMYVDAVFGVLVGTYVLYSAIIIIKNAIFDLMDVSLPKNMRNSIIETVCNIPNVLKVILLRTRSAGMKKYIEITVSANGDMTLNNTKILSTQIEVEINQMIKNADIVVRVVPS